MDQIIFEHRNQSYGAYQLRRQYPRVLVWSTMGVLAAFIAGMIAVLVSLRQKPERITEKPVYIVDIQPRSFPDRAPDTHLPSGGYRVPLVVPEVTDSLSPADTIVNDAYGNGVDTAGSGNGNGSGEGEGVVYYSTQQAPTFPGGEKERIRFMQHNIIYPPEARKNKIKGTVYVSFIVEKDGRISHVRLLKGIGYGCDEEALRVVNSMPRWEPGRQNGVAVRVHAMVPLIFTLN